MLKRPVEKGALFYGKRRRRTDVLFDEELRQLTRDSTQRLHALIRSRESRRWQCARKNAKVVRFFRLCLPDALRFRRGAAAWFDRQVHESVSSEVSCASI